jgi:hypothetical protein
VLRYRIHGTGDAMNQEQINSLSNKRRVLDLSPQRPWQELDILELERVAESCNLWGSDIDRDVIELAAQINKILKRKNYEKTAC